MVYLFRIFWIFSLVLFLLFLSMDITKCRCCLSQGVHKDLHAKYSYSGNNEIYSDMLYECFNIVLTTLENYPSSICEHCIVTLRSCVQFKEQVLTSEKQILRLANDLQYKVECLSEIKTEYAQDEAEPWDESDDNLLSDVTITKVKIEKPECTVKKKESSNRAKPKKIKGSKFEQEWSDKDVKDFVKTLSCSLGAKEITDISTINEDQITVNKVPTKRITISKGTKTDRTIKVLWSKSSKNEKAKHKENLMNILKFSNAVPFKDKTLLGFVCAYCDATYPDPMDLRAHTEIDHKKDRLISKTSRIENSNDCAVKLDVTELSCTLCEERMDDLYQFKDHLTQFHDKIIYDDIKDHIMQFKLKKGEVYDCALCASTYETFKMLKQHMNNHYRNYSCPKCDTSFATKRSLTSHMTTHDEGSFKCDHCDKVFPTKYKKQYHQKSHLGTRSIRNCPFCNESFKSYYQRNQHLINVHNSESQYRCNICDKSYILKSLLMYHIKKNHLMEKNFQCTLCGYRFFSKKALKAHMIKHTGERIYNCEVCMKSYARKYTLREHMRIHNNDRRFKCDLCSTSFVQKCSLKSHLLSNHGISMTASEISSTVPALGKI